MRSVRSEPETDSACAGDQGNTHALTIGTTMTMIKITIPTPTMILHFMSFHLMSRCSVEPVSNQQRILGQGKGKYREKETYHICFLTLLAPRRNPCAETARSSAKYISHVRLSYTPHHLPPPHFFRSQGSMHSVGSAKRLTALVTQSVQVGSTLGHLVDVIPHDPDG